MTEKEPKNLFEQRESPTPRPSLLDVVMIEGRLAQVSPTTDYIIFLDEKARTGDNKSYIINWDEYECEVVNSYVETLRKNNEISEEEYMAVRWGPEQKDRPYLRDYVTFFGKYKKKNKRKHRTTPNMRKK